MPSTLHAHVRDSVHRVVSNSCKNGMRFLLESGSTEGFLRDLLGIELKTRGYSLCREFQTNSHTKVDLVLRQGDPTYIEVKQLHMRDAGQYVKNVVHDLKRHPRRQCLGVVYLLDMKASRSKMKCPSFRDRNRKAKRGIREAMEALRLSFYLVYPHTETQARIRRFSDEGRLDLYAFVVKSVRPPRANRRGAV